MDKPTLSEIEDAAKVVYAHMMPTPQYAWPLLGRRVGAEVWVKHENHTPTGAFKVRGGLVYMDWLRRTEPSVTGVITATRGNHGQSIGRAAAAMGLSATIIVPHGNSPDKNSAMRALGVELIEYGHDFQEAYEHTASLANERNLHIIKAFSPMLVRGVATYSLEFFSHVPDMDTVYVPVGQGSGISAMIAARDALGLDTKIVGVVSENAPAYALSFAAKKAIATNSADTFADGVACRVPDEAALAIMLEGAVRIVTVSDDEIKAAIRYYYTDTHNLAEGAGAVPLAALMKDSDAMAGRKVGVVLSGGNIDRDQFAEILTGP